MATLVIAEVPGGTAEQDDAIVERMRGKFTGNLIRADGPIEGGWRIVSVWESREAWDAFRRDTLDPALKAAGRAAPDFQISELHCVRSPGDGL